MSPFSGVEACAPLPFASIVITEPSSEAVNLTLVFSSAFLHNSETTSKVNPSTCAEALSGTTFALTPPFTLITLGRAESSAYSLVKSVA